MAKDKKKSKGPKDRNSNYQMKNGNPVSKKKEKKPVAAPATAQESKTAVENKPRTKPGESRAAPKQPEQKSFLSGLTSSISNATSSISKMLKH